MTWNALWARKKQAPVLRTALDFHSTNNLICIGIDSSQVWLYNGISQKLEYATQK